jgi:hypothetical protein
VNPLSQTSLVNEVTIVVVPPEYLHLHASGPLWNDELPTAHQKGFIFANAESESEFKPHKVTRSKKRKV